MFFFRLNKLFCDWVYFKEKLDILSNVILFGGYWYLYRVLDFYGLISWGWL